MDKIIIEKLLSVISGYNKDGVLREMILYVEQGLDLVRITRLVTKGEDHKGTPFYTASARTTIIQEDYHDGELVFASVLYQEKE